jgi:xanthine/CO dehydrogenase XdhC/CoxF family maturation factor
MPPRWRLWPGLCLTLRWLIASRRGQWFGLSRGGSISLKHRSIRADFWQQRRRTTKVETRIDLENPDLGTRCDGGWKSGLV